MAKNLFFYQMNAEMSAILNNIDEIIFTSAEVENTLRKELKSAKKKAADAKEVAIAAGKQWTETEPEEKEINIIENKLSAVRKHKKEQLFGTKDSTGLYDMAGIDTDLYTSFSDMMLLGKTGAYDTDIRELCKKLGLDTSKQTTGNLANRLEKACGFNRPTTAGVRTGNRVTLPKENVFKEVFCGALLTFVAKKSNTVFIRTAENYETNVIFDSNLKVTELTAILSQKEEETKTEEVKEEVKEEKTTK